MAIARNDSTATGTSRGSDSITDSVETISDLKVYTGSADTIIVQGYYAAGDGGGGDFYWDSTSTDTANDGTIIQATGVTTGRWKRLYSGAVNVKWFGAKGDGTTDDYAAIQGAIDSQNTSNGGSVEIPTGDPYYVIGTKLVLYDAIILTGISPAEFTVSGLNPTKGAILRPNSSVSTGIEVYNRTSTGINNISVDCTDAASTFTGILWDGVQHSFIKNSNIVKLQNSNHTGISLVETGRGCYWNSIELVNIRGYKLSGDQNNGTGFKVQGNPALSPAEKVNQISFINCIVNNSDLGWVFDEVGAGITLINCTSETSDGNAVTITNISYGGAPTIIGGEYRKATGYGIDGNCLVINASFSNNTSGHVTNGALRQFVDDTSGDYLHQQYGVHVWDTSLQVTEPVLTAVTDQIPSSLFGVVSVQGDAAYTLTSTPTIQAGTRNGQLLKITARFPGANTITIQDNGTLPGSDLFLKGGGTLTLSSLTSVEFMWRSADSKWYEIGRN